MQCTCMSSDNVTGDNLPNYKVKIQRALSKWVHDYRMIQLCMMYI